MRAFVITTLVTRHSSELTTADPANDMATNDAIRNESFHEVETHEYKGTLYLHFSPASLLREVENFQFSSGDILLASYPKSGNCNVVNDFNLIL